METAMNNEIKHQATPVQTYEADWLKRRIEQRVPDSDGEGINIIIIDTLAYLDHPCFPSENIMEAWEFITRDDGVQIYPRVNRVDGTRFLNLNEKFSAHGTAIMGLLCAQSALIQVPHHLLCEQSALSDMNLSGLADTDTGELPVSDTGEQSISIELPALGLIPEANIYLIALSFDSDPDPYLSALKKAGDLSGQDGSWVIVMPRGIPRPDPALDEADDEKAQQWLEIDAQIRSIAMRAPFFYAAGNSQEDEITYPGTLFADATRTDLLFAVGARNSAGRESSYTSFADIYCLSDDAEAIYRNQDNDIYYLNEANTAHLDDPVRKAKAKECDYVFQRVITTDVPGRYGYNPSTLPTDQFDIETQYKKDLTSLFCEFGGTSAAAAVAGALAVRGLGSGVIDLSDVQAFRGWMSEKSE